MKKYNKGKYYKSKTTQNMRVFQAKCLWRYIYFYEQDGRLNMVEQNFFQSSVRQEGKGTRRNRSRDSSINYVERRNRRRELIYMNTTK